MDRPIQSPPADWEAKRFERQWNEGFKQHTFRARTQRDRDRILYSSALQRLSYVTQVTAPEAGYSFHNRLGHTLKVAQVGRRNVERLHTLAEEGQISGAAKELVLATDPDAVEASCLAHDLGHPPFGHISETVLHAKSKSHVRDGYEGNAQSFRIITRLAVRKDEQGLNLTRETLDSILKYPWRHRTDDPLPGKKRERKWGYYTEDADAFGFAREHWPKEKKGALPEKCLGAEIMDWADDLTYAVHDVDDFFRAGLVPLDRLQAPRTPEIKDLRQRMEELKAQDPKSFPPHSIDQLIEAARQIMSVYGPGEPYSHTLSGRSEMREFGTKLITRYLEAFWVVEDGGEARLQIDEQAELEVAALKTLVSVYVIHRPSLAVVQEGQKRLIGELFDCYFEASGKGQKGNHHLFPPGARERLEAGSGSASFRARVVLDLISGLTETAAIELHHRLRGLEPSRALDATAQMG